MTCNIGLLDDKYSKPWSNRIYYGNHDYNNKGHEDDIIPYEIGQEVHEGTIISNDWNKIVQFFEDRLAEIILSRCSSQKISDGYYILKFDAINPTKYKQSGITFSGFELTDKFVRLLSTYPKIKYKILCDKNNGQITINFNRPKFSDKYDKDKWNYLIKIADVLDKYYYDNNMYDMQNYLDYEKRCFDGQ